MKKFFISILYLINFAASKLSLLNIKEVVDDISKEMVDESLLRSSIVNPIFGYLFDATGALNNFRFYGPNLRITKDLNVRNYLKDQSNDPLTRLVIELFPSSMGYLQQTNHSLSNFYLFFQFNKEKGIELMADCFVKLLKSEKNMIYKGINEIFEFKKFKTMLFCPNQESVFSESDQKMIKLLVIHAFIIYSLENKEDLKKYLKFILERVEIQDVDIYVSNIDILDGVSKLQQKFKSFPYSELNQPPSNSSIPIYDRKTDSFEENKMFADCADVLLLNICNCLFYDPENCCYSTENLDKNSNLSKFYQKHSRLFTITEDIRREWTKVIQGLENFGIVDGNDCEFKTHLIVYLRGKRNEIKSGIINMMNVLIKICNVNHKVFWDDFDGYNLEAKLEQLFKFISPKFQWNRLKIKVNSNSLSAFESRGRIDFIGTFELIFFQPDNKTVKLKIIQGLKHAKTEIITFEQDNKNEIVIPEITSHFYRLPVVVFRNYVTSAQNKVNTGNRYQDIFTRIYFSGITETNDQKKELLLDICKSIINLENNYFVTENSKRSKILNQTVENILSTINLSDLAVKSIFTPFLFYSRDFSDEIMTKGWITSFGFISVELYKLWESVFLNLNCEKLTLVLSEIPIIRIPALFETLRKIKSLKSLQLRGIQKENCETISKELSLLTQLESLCLSNSFIDSTDPKIIVEALGKLTNLKHLDLSRNTFNLESSKAVAEVLENLIGLESLNLACSYFGDDGSKMIAEAIEKLINLKNLNIFYLNLNNEEMPCFSKAIETITALTHLNY